ncbi:Uncharacterized protein dnm_061960 [Desulfonema magnum]|uniref:Uncharacterized protein n=1 Tax=Desulfonema magnum TaxID=45655 RepID=A0A975GQQ0_9BACT|nr:Uncharacterized protein dnm_061960 [Desulfonema magnum]
MEALSPGAEKASDLAMFDPVILFLGQFPRINIPDIFFRQSPWPELKECCKIYLVIIIILPFSDDVFSMFSDNKLLDMNFQV